MRVHEHTTCELRGRRAHQDEVERPRAPLLYRFLSVFGDVVLNFLPPHERGQDSLVDGVI